MGKVVHRYGLTLIKCKGRAALWASAGFCVILFYNYRCNFYKYCCNKNAYLWHNSALLGAHLCPLRRNYTEREVILPTIGAISAEKPEVVILMNHIPLTAWLRHQSKVLIDSLEISKMCCCVEDLKRFIVNLPCCLWQGCCHN